MRKRAFAIITALVLGIGGAVVFAPPVSAHDPSITITCDTVRYQFEHYVGSDNTFTLYVDDMTTPALEVTFGEQLINQPAFALDPTYPQTIRYSIDATEASGKYDYDSPAIVTTPCDYAARAVYTTCTKITTIWGGPLDTDFRLEATVRTEYGDRVVSAAVVSGVDGGYGVDELGVRSTDWNGATTEEPLSEFEVKSGEFVFPYRGYAGNPIPFSVAVSLAGRLISTYDDMQCGFDGITVKAEPTFTPATCTTAGELLLPDNPGVDWVVQPLDGPPDARGPGRYLVLAVAQFGHSITGPSTFAVTVPKAGGAACFDPPTLATVTATATATQGACPVGGGTYTLSDTHGVQWLVDGAPAKPGTHQADAGSTVVIDATLPDPINNGWNDPDQKTKWTFVFTDSLRGCDLATLALTGGAIHVLLWIVVGTLLTGAGVAFVAVRRLRRTG